MRDAGENELEKYEEKGDASKHNLEWERKGE